MWCEVALWAATPQPKPKSKDTIEKRKKYKKTTKTVLFIKAARLQNEIAPEKLLNRYAKRFEKREKKIRKTIRNAFEKCLAPLRPLKNISPALFNKF